MSKWALVTGATVGIGESFTRVLAHEGFNIVLVARDLERMKERAASLESRYKVQTAIVQADLATDVGCAKVEKYISCLLYTSPSPRDRTRSRMPSSA